MIYNYEPHIMPANQFFCLYEYRWMINNILISLNASKLESEYDTRITLNLHWRIAAQSSVINPLSRELLA